MKKRRLPMFILLMLSCVLFSFRGMAASSWTTNNDAVYSNGICTLTESKSNTAGGLSYTAPLDMRKGFTISFDYWIGNIVDSPREGFTLVFSDKEVGSAKTSSVPGYVSYIYGDQFYGIIFDTHTIPYGDVIAAKNTGSSVTRLVSSQATMCDSQWHHVLVSCHGSQLTVKQDGETVLTCSEFNPPDMSYFGFTASTYLYAFGYQKHMLRNISIQSAEASLIRLDACGGTADCSSMFVLPNSSGSLPVPERTGYTFSGWYTAAKGGTRINGTNYNFAYGQTVYAHWTDNRIQVKFNANKGSLSASKSTRKVNYNAKVGSLPTPKRNKYTFLGWYTKKSGGKKITADTVIKGKTTYYAHWVSNSKKIAIKLKANGGSCGKTVLKASYGGILTGLPTPGRKGYTFLGWYTAKTGGKKVTSSTKTAKLLPCRTLYAHWKKKNSGTGSKGSREDCWYCNGSGKCPTCGGSGTVYKYMAGIIGRQEFTCTDCYSPGKCRMCGGSGKKK